MAIKTTGRVIGVGHEGRVDYTVTQRGAPCLMIDGFGFVARKRRGSRVYWTCRNRKQFNCYARGLTNDGKLVMSFSTHSHPPPSIAELKRIESLIEIVSNES